MWNDVHGGLTPPAPGWRCECLPAKSDFCDGRTHVPKSGGREPAVVRNESRLQGTANNVRPIMPVQSAAETVSPPWIANAGAIAEVFHGRLTPTAPGARRSSAEQGAIGSAQTHVHKSGGRQRAGVAVRSAQQRFAPQSHIVAARVNGSGDRHPAVARRRMCEENRKLQLAPRDSAAAIAMRFSGAASAVIRVLGDRRCKRVFGIHGGLTPPAIASRCDGRG
jgi:hypothetical protein